MSRRPRFRGTSPLSALALACLLVSPGASQELPPAPTVGPPAGTLVAAGLDQSPPQFRATSQSFLPMFQAIAALGAGVISGLLADSLGLPTAILILLVVGMVGGMLLLNMARKSYDGDQHKQNALGEFAIDLE